MVRALQPLIDPGLGILPANRFLRRASESHDRCFKGLQVSDGDTVNCREVTPKLRKRRKPRTQTGAFGGHTFCAATLRPFVGDRYTLSLLLVVGTQDRRLLRSLDGFEDDFGILFLEASRAAPEIARPRAGGGMQSGQQQLMRDAVFRGEEDLRLHAQPDREHFHVPDSVLGSVNGLGDPQDADPTADPGNVAEQLVAGLDLLASVEPPLPEARDLRPSLLELLQRFHSEQIKPVVH